MVSPVIQAIKDISEEKNIKFETVIETIEAALAAAYRKDFGQKNQNIKVEFDQVTGDARVYDVKTVVPDMELPSEEELAALEEKKETEEPADDGEFKFNPKLHVMISEAQKIKSDAKEGDEIKTELNIPAAYGRMAAQTAKQVIMQKLREAERENLFAEFKGKEYTLITGTVQRREGRLVLIDLGRITAVMPGEEQVPIEEYRPGSRIKVYVKSVTMASRGPEVLVSRAAPELLTKLFALEIPEVGNGTVVINAVAREAGFRSKVAVSTSNPNIDPIGSCIGQRGARIQTVISEIGGEKIDIIAYNENNGEYIQHALSPAKVIGVEINEETHEAKARVSEDQLSLAIGKGGQNVRLAAKLTGWKISVIEEKKTTPDAVATPEGEAIVTESNEAPAL